MFSKSASILAFVLLASFAVSAETKTHVQRHVEDVVRNNKIIYVDGKPDEGTKAAVDDSLRQEIINFYYDQFRHFDDPVAPYFQFMSRDARMSMGLGGAVRMRGYYDWGGAVPSPAFAPYMIPIPADPASMRQFGTTPAGTCLFFQVLGNSEVFGKFQLYIEANFNGYQARDFHLKKAYAQFRDITVGLASSTFSDPAAQTPMIDANGAANKIAPCNVLVRYMPTIARRWVVAVSAESPDVQPGYALDGSTNAKVRSWFPEFDTFIQYQWAKGQHVRVSAMYRLMSYRNLVEEKNTNVSGWGLQLSSVANPLPQITTYLTASYGHGYTSTLADMQIGNYDLISDIDHPGKMYSPAAYGWSAGVQYNFKPSLFSTVSMSQVRYLPKRMTDGGEYRYGQLVTVNLFWNPSPRTQFGIEFDWGRRKNQSGVSRTAKRVGALVQFSF